MNRKEPVMMISNWKKPFGLQGFLKNSALQGLSAKHDYNSFYQPIKSLLTGMKCVFKHQELQKFVPN